MTKKIFSFTGIEIAVLDKHSLICVPERFLEAIVAISPVGSIRITQEETYDISFLRCTVVQPERYVERTHSLQKGKLCLNGYNNLFPQRTVSFVPMGTHFELWDWCAYRAWEDALRASPEYEKLLAKLATL